jgi:hypothetical protein
MVRCSGAAATAEAAMRLGGCIGGCAVLKLFIEAVAHLQTRAPAEGEKFH